MNRTERNQRKMENMYTVIIENDKKKTVRTISTHTLTRDEKNDRESREALQELKHYRN